jgi:hypothetical protein
VVGVEAGMEEAKQGPILALVGPHLLCSTPPPSCVGTRDLLLRQLVKMMLYNASSRVCRISENGTRVSTEEATHTRANCKISATQTAPTGALYVPSVMHYWRQSKSNSKRLAILVIIS